MTNDTFCRATPLFSRCNQTQLLRLLIHWRSKISSFRHQLGAQRYLPRVIYSSLWKFRNSHHHLWQEWVNFVSVCEIFNFCISICSNLSLSSVFCFSWVIATSTKFFPCFSSDCWFVISSTQLSTAFKNGRNKGSGKYIPYSSKFSCYNIFINFVIISPFMNHENKYYGRAARLPFHSRRATSTWVARIDNGSYITAI